MILAKVVGTVVATRKDPRLVSSKLLIARPMDPKGKPEGNYVVAIDTVDAGFGETVLIVSGSSARMAECERHNCSTATHLPLRVSGSREPRFKPNRSRKP